MQKNTGAAKTAGIRMMGSFEHCCEMLMDESYLSPVYGSRHISGQIKQIGNEIP